MPPGLAGLLGKLGLGMGKPELKGPTKAEAKGMEGEGEALLKGEEIGPDGALLAGIGFNGKDKKTQQKNKIEKANVERFLKELGKEGAQEAKEVPAEAQAAPNEEAKDTSEAQNEAGEVNQNETQEQSETKEKAQLKEEHKEDARLQGQAEAKEQQELKEQREADQSEQQQEKDQQEQQDEDEKPGAGWVLEEHEDEKKRRKFGLRSADSLGHQTRCKGTLEDGSRCLRKPSEGSPYCLEHGHSYKVEPIE